MKPEEALEVVSGVLKTHKYQESSNGSKNCKRKLDERDNERKKGFLKEPPIQINHKDWTMPTIGNLRQHGAKLSDTWQH